MTFQEKNAMLSHQFDMGIANVNQEIEVFSIHLGGIALMRSNNFNHPKGTTFHQINQVHMHYLDEGNAQMNQIN